MTFRYRLVGVIHLPALPGSPRNTLSARDAARSAANDAKAMADAGFDLVMLENFGDVPFFAGRVPAITVSAMTACALAAREACPALPLGINVLRNDADAALAIAHVIGATCIRVNVHTGARVTDQGVIEGDAAATVRTRKSLGAEGIALWCDVDVKHSAPLAHRSLTQEASDLVVRAMADALIVTGEGTGRAVDAAKLDEVRRAAPKSPLLVGSGATIDSLRELATRSDGVIVGSALREGGIAGGPIDPKRAREFAAAFRVAFPKSE